MAAPLGVHSIKQWARGRTWLTLQQHLADLTHGQAASVRMREDGLADVLGELRGKVAVYRAAPGGQQVHVDRA